MKTHYDANDTKVDMMHDVLDPGDVDKNGRRYTDELAFEQASKSLEQELFDMVYGWGRFGVVTDHTAVAFQDTLNKIVLIRSERPF